MVSPLGPEHNCPLAHNPRSFNAMRWNQTRCAASITARQSPSFGLILPHFASVVGRFEGDFQGGLMNNLDKPRSPNRVAGKLRAAPPNPPRDTQGDRQPHGAGVAEDATD